MILVTVRRALASTVTLVAACGSSGPSGPPVTIIAHAGTRLAPGITVITHRDDGSIIDRTATDGDGSASLATEANALVTVGFTDPAAAFVTTLAPAASASLDIYGPPPTPPPGVIVGGLHVAVGTPLAADYYDVDLGCATIRVTSLPADIGVLAPCLGSDSNLDIVVTAVQLAGGDPQILGTAAGRVPLDDTGAATFSFAQFASTGLAVPVTSAVTTSALTWTLWSDGLPLVVAPLADPGELPIGLVVDRASVQASLVQPGAAQLTTLELAGAPTAITLAATDFLPAIATSVATTTTGYTWSAAGLGAAVDLDVASDSGRWNIVLPPDADHVAIPDLEAIAPTGTVAMVLRYVDATNLADFASLSAAGIHAEQTQAESTIVPDPAAGRIRVTQAQ